jgi:hypothetical protein
MTHDEFEQKQYHISVCAGQNQRYHQRRAHLWTRWDRGVRIAVGVLAVIAFSLAIVATFRHSGLVDWLGVIAAFAAAVAAVVLNVMPLGEWSAQHLDLFRRWTDLREDIDALEFDFQGDPTQELIDRLKALDATVHRICGTESVGPKKSLLDECYREEVRSRHPSAQATSCA